MTDELDGRISLGIELLTAYFSRDGETGALDESLLRAVMGAPVTDDDVIRGLSSMVNVSELLLMMHVRDGGRMPLDLLRELAAHRASQE